MPPSVSKCLILLSVFVLHLQPIGGDADVSIELVLRETRGLITCARLRTGVIKQCMNTYARMSKHVHMIKHALWLICLFFVAACNSATPTPSPSPTAPPTTAAPTCKPIDPSSSTPRAHCASIDRMPPISRTNSTSRVWRSGSTQQSKKRCNAIAGAPAIGSAINISLIRRSITSQITSSRPRPPSSIGW